MRRVAKLIAAACAFAAAALPAVAKHHHHGGIDVGPSPASGLADVTLLVVRHAEKPADPGDPGLSPAGRARAKAYASYFRHFAIDGRQVRIDTLIASADSDTSARPRLTLEPLSKATGIPIQTPFKNKHYADAATWISQGATHGTALIAWHHGKLPDLLAALGAPNVLPGGSWAADVYDWVVVLRYGSDGRLASAARITEPADLK